MKTCLSAGQRLASSLGCSRRTAQRFGVIAAFAALIPSVGVHAQAPIESVPQGPAPAQEPSQLAPDRPELDRTGETSPGASPAAPPGGEASESFEPPRAAPGPSEASTAAEDPREQAEHDALLQRLDVVETRLAQLDQERADEGAIAGPIAMLASGYATGIAALAVSLGSFAAAEQVQDQDPGDDSRGHLDINNDGSVDSQDERVLRRVSRGFGVLSAAGMAVGIVGSVLLAKRLHERRRLDPEVRSLQRRRRELRRELEYGANVTSRGLALSLTGRF